MNKANCSGKKELFLVQGTERNVSRESGKVGWRLSGYPVLKTASWDILGKFHEWLPGRDLSAAQWQNSKAQLVKVYRTQECDPEMSSPRGSAVKNYLQRRSCWRYGFNPWVRKIPWTRKWEPTPVFMPRESWTEGPGGLLSIGSQRVRHH